MRKKNKIAFWKYAKKIILGLFLLFVSAILFIRSPWGQDIIVTKVTSYISKKTQTKIKIDKLYLTFTGNLHMKGLYMEDTLGDTLVYSKSLESSIALLPLLRGSEINIKSIEWEGLRANIIRLENTETYNFSFLIDAFASNDTITKTETSKPLKFSINTVSLKKININYNDALLGIESHLKLGNFKLVSEALDIEKSQFKITKVILKDSDLTYLQTKTFVETEDDTNSISPFISINEIKVENTHINCNVLPEKLKLGALIGHFSTSIPKLDIKKQAIALKYLRLNKSKINFQSLATATVTNQPNNFTWPNWKLSIDDIDIKNNTIAGKTGLKPNVNKEINFENIVANRFTLRAKNVNYAPKNLKGVINRFSFDERSGFSLKKLNVDFNVSDTNTIISKLFIATNNNSINGLIELNYASVNKLIEVPEQTIFKAILPALSLNPKDAYNLEPSLKQNEYIQAFSKKNLSGELNINGTLEHFDVSKSNLKWGTTTLVTSGNVSNISETSKLKIGLSNFRVKTFKNDILSFISEERLGIEIPESIELLGTVSGSLSNLKGKATLDIPDGSIIVDGAFKTEENLAFKGTFNINDFNLGKILKTDKVGIISFTSLIDAQGKTINSLTGTLRSEFKKLELNNYDYSNLKLDGNITNGKGIINLNYKDENLDLTSITELQLDTIATKIKTKLQLNGAHFKSLGITEEDVRAKFAMELDFAGNTKDFLFQTNTKDAIVIRNKKKLAIGDVLLKASVKNGTTMASVKSNPIDGNLSGNTNPAGLIKALEQHFDAYFRETPSVKGTALMSFNASIKQAPILKDVFLPNLEALDPVKIKIHFDEAKETVTAQINTSHLIYSGNTIDSLQFNLDSKNKHLNFDFDLAKLKTGMLDVKTISMKGYNKEKILFLDFNAFDSEEKLIKIQSEIEKQNDTIKYHINPLTLLLNKKKWRIPTTNLVEIAPNSINFKDFVLSKNDQKIIISNSLKNSNKAHIGFEFSNFNINTITSLFNSNKPLASGILNGQFIIENPYSKMGLIAKTTITDFEIMNIPMGFLEFKATSQNSTAYLLNLGVNSDNINLNIAGTYTALEEKSNLDFNINLEDLKLQPFEKLVSNYISKTSGSLKGNIKLSGTATTPEILGGLHFEASGFTINSLNTAFTLPSESIQINSEHISFDKFTMLDSNQNPFVLDGKITTKTLENPTFSLSLKAENTQVLNATKQDNELFYGTVNLDTDITVGGSLNLPKIKGSLKINKNSNFTYVIPEDEINTVEKEGIVLFVNKKNPDDILTRKNLEVSSTAPITGLDIDAQLTVSKSATFNIVVDAKTGDNLKISGTGDFKVGVQPEGTTTLSGKYEVNKGHYEVSLYNLVKKRFDIAQGSTIIWRGNPLDADMDIRAIYAVETQASGLMATKLSSKNATVSNKFRQKLPFLVYLNIKGELLKPDLSFNLDMPKDTKGELGGEVYSQVQQLNTEEEELNKQVFSLLVLNQFFPSSASDGSSGGSLSIARDNVNNMLSDQITNFSNKLVGKTGVTLDVGLDSYTDYQGNTPINKTQLDVNASKRLFNNKLIVEVGSGIDIQENSQNAGQATPLVGTVNIQYLFSENGRWRLKAFRKNKFESVVDGQVVVTGIALVFNREFNKFKELWQKILRNEEINAIKTEDKE